MPHDEPLVFSFSAREIRSGEVQPDENGELPPLPASFFNTSAVPGAATNHPAGKPCLTFHPKELDRNFQAHFFPDFRNVLRVEEAGQAADQPFQCFSIKPVRKPKTMHDIHVALAVSPLAMSKLHVFNPV